MALSYAKPSLSVIDVGADHGYLSLALFDMGKKVYAVENKKGPFNTLCSSLGPLKDNGIYPLFQDGLSSLPDDVEEIFILGMGGKTIRRILSDVKTKLGQIKHLVVEPQSDIELVTEFLRDYGFMNTSGCYVYEKHYYPILSYEKGNETLSKEELRFGKAPIQQKDQNLKAFLLEQIAYWDELKVNKPLKDEKKSMYQAILDKYFSSDLK